MTSTKLTDGLTQEAAAIFTTGLPVTAGATEVQFCIVMSLGNVISAAVKGSVGPVMVINWVHSEVLPEASVAVNDLVMVPILHELVANITCGVIPAGGQLSVAVAPGKPPKPLKLAQLMVKLAGQVITGSRVSRTVTKAVHVAEVPLVDVTVNVTVSGDKLMSLQKNWFGLTANDIGRLSQPGELPLLTAEAASTTAPVASRYTVTFLQSATGWLLVDTVTVADSVSVQPLALVTVTV